MSATLTDRALKAARQFIETSSLLGVESVPMAPQGPAIDQTGVAAPATNAPETLAKAKLLDELRDLYDREMPPEPGAMHTRLVFGDGHPDADLMFIGEAPGAEEDRLGIPFVGRSGQKLNDMIQAMGLSRETVYIANVLKRRPPGNATPTPEEAQRHGPWLLRQIEIIEPRVIVTLGKPAAHFLLDTTNTMSSLRGHWFEYHGIPVMPTFHPAYLLRSYTKENRQKVWSDLQMALAKINEPTP